MFSPFVYGSTSPTQHLLLLLLLQRNNVNECKNVLHALLIIKGENMMIMNEFSLL